MERLPPERSERFLTLGAELPGLGLEVRAVDGIAQQRVSDMGKMHPDLMGSAGLELAGQQRGDRLAVVPVECFAKLPMGDRLAPAVADRHFLAGIGVTVDRCIDG